MKLTGVIVVVVLAAWAASLAPSDARQRGGKQPNAARHAGVTGPAGAVKLRGTAAPVIHAAPAFTKKNSIGATIPSAGITSPKPSVATNAGPNAAGARSTGPLGARPAIIALPPAPTGVAKIAPGAGATTFVRSAAPAPSAHGGAISGTGIARPGTTPGVVGGPAKVAGGITGTGMKPKR